jgi:hypothetical protein
MISEKTLTGEVQGTLLTPARTTGLGVVVLTGSSVRTDSGRASPFAANSALALALRWFGGDGLTPVIYEVPLEGFFQSNGEIAGCDRIAYVGTSRGAEAASLVAIADPRIDVVVTISPTSVVWGGDGQPASSSWTRNGTLCPLFTTVSRLSQRKSVARFHTGGTSTRVWSASWMKYPQQRSRSRRRERG